MTKLCLGGTFNPIHHGHLLCARTAAEALGLETATLVLAGHPPHKRSSPDIVAPEHRIRMCRLAVQGIKEFAIDDRELHRIGPSYTIDTIRELKREGVGDVFWLIGADQLMMLPTWQEPDALLHEARFVILARPGWSLDWQTLPAAFRHLRDNIVTAPLLGISASDIRRRVGEGKPIDFLTPPSVVRYIHDNGLYRA